MAGGPILPSSIYVGGASGSLSPTVYTPVTNTNSGGAFEGVGVSISTSSSSSPFPAVLQFNMPESIPTGTLKLRTLVMTTTTSTTQNMKFTVVDGVTSAGSNIGATTVTSESQTTVTSAGADLLNETKVTLSASPSANQILTCVINYNSTGTWTATSASVWNFSVVWE